MDFDPTAYQFSDLDKKHKCVTFEISERESRGYKQEHCDAILLFMLRMMFKDNADMDR